MAERLRGTVKYHKYREIQRMARSRHLSIVEWVRQALDLARWREPLGDLGKKLEVIRMAARQDYFSGDVSALSSFSLVLEVLPKRP